MFSATESGFFMRSEAFKCGWFALLGAIFLFALLQNFAHATEKQSAVGNAFSNITPASQKVREAFNIRKKSTKAKVGKVGSAPSLNIGVANNAKRFGKLSLILSTELTQVEHNPIPSSGSTRTLNRPQGGETKNKALTELNAQIASLEATIEAQQLHLGLDQKGEPLPKQVTRSVGSSISASDSSSKQPGIKKQGSWLSFGLVVVILLVALGIFLMRNKKAAPFDTDVSDQIAIRVNEEPEDTQGLELSSPENTVGEQLTEHRGNDGAQEELLSILPPEYEMLEEADIYLRFGHDKLAEEALSEAIKINPRNSQGYLRLLRIYFSREDADGFLELAKQIKSLGDESIWSEVAEMGRNLDEGNALYQ